MYIVQVHFCNILVQSLRDLVHQLHLWVLDPVHLQKESVVHGGQRFQREFSRN